MLYKNSGTIQDLGAKPVRTSKTIYRLLIICVILSTMLAASSCDSSDNEQIPFNTGETDAGNPQADTGTQPGVVDPGDSDTQTPVVDQADTGTSTPVVDQADAGTQKPTGGGEGIAIDAGTNPQTEAGTNPQTQEDSAVSPVDAGGDVPSGPVDYGAPGPYEVVIEKNVGESYRNTNVADDIATCQGFMALMQSDDPVLIEELTSYPADMDRQLYTLFRPTNLEEGKKYPVITWGNGTCSQPMLFVELLEHLASHGFLVIASNSRWTGSGVEMLRGIDFMLSEDENPDSTLYGKVDRQMLGACGHSQGSMATTVAGTDPRIVATVPIMGAIATSVAALNGPTFLIAGELDDIVPAAGIESAFQAATVPAVYGLIFGYDHLMPGKDPTPILEAVTAWFKIHLSNDEAARDLFYGDACGLCNDPAWAIQRKNL